MGCNNGWGGSCLWIIIILIILFCGCGNNNWGSCGWGCNNNTWNNNSGCGCN